MTGVASSKKLGSFCMVVMRSAMGVAGGEYVLLTGTK